jgi:pimeloyl-ACP methyl ester carboxylesterase
MNDVRSLRVAVIRSMAGLAAAALLALAPTAAHAEAGGLRCQEVSFPVTLSPGDATVYDVVADLCAKGSVHGKTFQITTSGATYGHVYWDFPYRPEIYSYVRRAAAAGYAVVNVDRIGVGRSDHPPASAITLQVDAYVAHQIVQALRGGDLVVPKFGRIRAERVVGVGHALGSAITILEAAYYGDVDGVVLTGLTHTPGAGLMEAFSFFYPASLDPVLAGRGLTEGYLTARPGHRADLFYHPPFDPHVVALDEQIKETVTTGELSNPFVWLQPSRDIHVPVLVIVGDYDRVFCGLPTCSASNTFANEASFYAPDACLETVAIPDAGNDLNLHPNAQVSYGAVLDWIGRRVGGDPRAPAPQPCQP